jgi:hypothetical protein
MKFVFILLVDYISHANYKHVSSLYTASTNRTKITILISILNISTNL